MASFPHYPQNILHHLYILLLLLRTSQCAPVLQAPKVGLSGLMYHFPTSVLRRLGNEQRLKKEDLCTAVPLKVAQVANLTAKEVEVLPLMCWNQLQEMRNGILPHMFVTPGVPIGVKCQKMLRCDSMEFCAEVCKQGSVVLSSWLTKTIKYQNGLSRTLPMKFVQFLGTHNSAITIANGYGIRDRFYSSMLASSYAPGGKQIQTSDQWFTLTDQLKMGIRMIELDVHWIRGFLRISHCGGTDNPILDNMITTLNTMAKLLNLPTVKWDTGTIGCDPSLNSMDPLDERRFLSALLEIKEWFYNEENKQEFLIVYLDTEMNLQYWGKLAELRKEILSVFPESSILTPGDIESQGKCPGCATIGSFTSMGRRMMFVTRQEFSASANDILFRRSGTAAYGWSESPMYDFLKPHECSSTMDGNTVRVSTCELTYGFLNCNLELASNGAVLNTRTLPGIMQCGVNFPCPDRLTPQRAESSIWSWAPNEPNSWIPKSMAIIIMAAHDGRWRRKLWNPAVSEKLACRKTNLDGKWGWVLVSGGGTCPTGYSFGIPRHAKENALLRNLLLSQAVSEVRLKGVS